MAPAPNPSAQCDGRPISPAPAAHHLATVTPGPQGAGGGRVAHPAGRHGRQPNLAPSTPTADLLFGWPASYWLDLRGYKPVGTAAALNRPILILQGGRDYQVTVEDDLARWQAGLAHRPEVTVRVHDAADHLFFRGDGPSTLADYESPQHVDPAVVADIAAWLTTSQRTVARLAARLKGRRRH